MTQPQNMCCIWTVDAMINEGRVLRPSIVVIVGRWTFVCLPRVPSRLRRIAWRCRGAGTGAGTSAVRKELNTGPPSPPMMPVRRLERQLPLVIAEVLGAVVVDVKHAHGGLEVGVPGGREVHDQVQAVVGFYGELAL